MKKWFLWTLLIAIIVMALVFIPLVALADGGGDAVQGAEQVQADAAEDAAPVMADTAAETDPGGGFTTWAVVITYGGCIVVTLIATQFIKPVWPKKIKTQFLSYIIALALLIVGNWIMGTLSAETISISVINAIFVAIGANGGFNNLQEANAAKTKDEPHDTSGLDGA